jgi:HNH endonuclease.
VARTLRNHHKYDREDSLILAEQICDPKSMCQICGVPNSFIFEVYRQGGPFPRRGNQNRRLTVDHIVPGGPSILKNTRLLCWGCNEIRGENRRSDKQVLQKIARLYKFLFSEEKLSWLNAS